MKIILFIFSLLLGKNLIGQTCEEWFVKSKILPGKDCIARCVGLPVGMGDWECTAQCSKLCASPTALEKLLGKLAYYPGLTKQEHDLISKKPKEAITVFIQKQKAESMTQLKFGRDGVGDESDAYRHFVWAALLERELGADTAKEFLDAHETSQFGDDLDRAMDLANNRDGLLAAAKLRREGDNSDEKIRAAAMSALNKGTLIVLSPFEREKP